MKILLLLLAVLGACSAATTPTWLSAHIVEGVIELPYAEITEPFTAYYNSSAKKSRIDYYGGETKTYQRADEANYGKSYKLTFMTDYVKKAFNIPVCFLTNGSKASTVSIQSALPDLSGFKMISSRSVAGKSTEVWQLINTIGQKTNKYQMTVQRDTVSGAVTPKGYLMLGYDSLYGSHFDKYYISYDNYRPLDKDDYFNVPNESSCTGYPGPGAGGASHLSAEEHMVLDNPMKQYIGEDESHVDPMFYSFKTKFGVLYKHKTEHEKRKNIFRHNVRFIHSTNRRQLSYRVAVNHLADRTDTERRILRGRLRSTGYNGGLPFDKKAEMKKAGLKDLPESIDWRLYGAVTPVKDQAICGSCWSFGTTGTVEGALFLKTGVLTKLSEQALMDCSWGEGNNACDGGEDYRAYQWIMLNGGIPTDWAYGPYKGQDGKCHAMTANKTANIKSYVNVTAYDQGALKAAISLYGPVSVAINAALKSFSFYSHGVYYDPTCAGKPDDLDHAVLAVGYGVMQGEAYWLIKNSWSTYWGNNGYVLLSLRNNDCGVATSPTYVQLA